jgi:hypothetical protein
MQVEAKEKPKWHQIRWKVSNLLVKMARFIHPENPEVMAFYTQLLLDQMIYGRAIARFPWDDMIPSWEEVQKLCK